VRLGRDGRQAGMAAEQAVTTFLATGSYRGPIVAGSLRPRPGGVSMIRFSRAGVAAVLAAMTTSCASAQSPDLARAADFAINNVTTSLYHEFGHLLIDQFEWPLLGREENAADTIMTMILLDDGEGSAAIAADAVRGYMLASRRYGETLPENHDFKGEHELEVQRGFLMACVLVGSDRDTYEDLAAEIGLSDNRTESCREDARLAERSWGALKDRLSTSDRDDDDDDDRRRRRDRDDDDDDDESRRAGSAVALSAAITVTYEDATGYEPIATLMKERRLLETVAERLMSRFPLRREAEIVATLCGDDDAYYGGDKITLCYEYTQFYYDLIADFDRAGAGMI
jgi:hypothetical protein